MNFEENVEKWTQIERKSPIGQLEKKDEKMVYKVYFKDKAYK